MPDFTTHHIFGQQIYEILPPERKAAVDSVPDAFYWGLQGPDLLFFHRAVWDKSHLPDVGRTMHQDKTAALFEVLLNDVISHRKQVNFPILAAYCQGFICHYTLDRQVHPYVYSRQKEMEPPEPKDSSVHWKIEAAIDRELYQLLYGKEIRDFPLAEYYKVVPDVRDSVAALYERIAKKVYGLDVPARTVANCFRDCIWLNRLLYDKSGRIQPVAGRVQSLLKKGELLTGHMKAGSLDGDFLNLAKRTWHNPNRPEKEENASVPELMNAAALATEALQQAFFEAVHKGDRQGLAHADFRYSFVDGKFR